MKKIKLPYIVIDTNVLISAGLLPDSKTAHVVSLAVKHFAIAQNKNTWQEIETRIVRKKFDRYFGIDGRRRHLATISRSVEFFESHAVESASPDPDDNMFLGLAIDAGAKIIISGDPDLKNLKTHKGILVIPPAEFFEKFNQLP
jgi:uncharacterized protein